MSAPGNIADEIKTRRSAVAFIGNSVAALSVLVIGDPLAPAAIRTMLIGWILIAAGATRFILGHHFQTTGPDHEDDTRTLDGLWTLSVAVDT